ncbi:unnamed protein product [Durusdinium trenchii]|uniref:Pentatricopeptide repeat-containing protein, chloroplastic n=1 Tax=Durusdinium trenchii TaxID=1381693 RepID=A0ABP0QHS2_9DINO
MNLRIIEVQGPSEVQISCENSLKPLNLPEASCAAEGLGQLRLELGSSLQSGTYAFSVHGDLPTVTPPQNDFSMIIRQVPTEQVADAAFGVPGWPLGELETSQPLLAWSTAGVGEVSSVTISFFMRNVTGALRALLINLPSGFQHRVRGSNEFKVSNPKLPLLKGASDWLEVSQLDRIVVRLEPEDPVVSVGSYMFTFPVALPRAELLPAVNFWRLSFCSSRSCVLPTDKAVLLSFPMAGFMPGEISLLEQHRQQLARTEVTGAPREADSDSLQLGAPAVPVRSAQHLTRTIRLQDPTPNRCPAAAPRSGLTAQPAAAPASRRPGPRKHGEDRDGPSTEHRAKLDEEKLRLNIGGKKVEERISLASGSAGDRIPALHFLTDLPPSVWRFQTSHHRTGRGFHASEKADSAVGFVGTEPGRVAPCGRGNVIGETRVERRSGVITAEEKACQWTQAIGTLMSFDLGLTTISVSGAISACRQAWRRANQLMSLLLQSPVQPDAVACNALLTATAALAWEKAEALLPPFQCWGVRCTLVTLNACADGSAKAKQWRRPLNLLQEARAAPLVPDVVSLTASVTGLKKCRGPWGHAIALLANMATREVRENVLTWNALMSACRPGEEDEVEEAVRAAEWHQGLHCLALMGQRSLQLSDASRNVPLCSLEETSSDQARDELKEMRPRPWRQVLALFHTFEEETFQPTRLAWGAVLGVLARQALWAGALGALNTLVPTVDASRLWTGVDANGLRCPASRHPRQMRCTMTCWCRPATARPLAPPRGGFSQTCAMSFSCSTRPTGSRP